MDDVDESDDNSDDDVDDVDERDDNSDDDVDDVDEWRLWLY